MDLYSSQKSRKEATLNKINTSTMPSDLRMQCIIEHNVITVLQNSI